MRARNRCQEVPGGFLIPGASTYHPKDDIYRAMIRARRNEAEPQ
jgi:hypothetical protein